MMGAIAEGVVRNVVFDIGGVLLDWDPRHLYSDPVADPAELEWFLANVCTMVSNAALDAGTPSDTASAAPQAATPHHPQPEHVKIHRPQPCECSGQYSQLPVDAL